jgi:hypothetical protein
MKSLKQLREDGYSICVPQKPKIDTGIINKLQCQLMCHTGSVVVHVIRACDCLARGIFIVDKSGDIVTSLDYDLEKKFVVTGNDLNLWYALLQSATNDGEIGIEVLNSISNRYLRF